MFEKITRESRARGVAESWRGRYKKGAKTRYHDCNETYASLKALGETPNPDEVDCIIGNTSWTRVEECTQCGKEDAPFVVQVGDEPDYESRTAWLCPDCIKALYEFAFKEPPAHD